MTPGENLIHATFKLDIPAIVDAVEQGADVNEFYAISSTSTVQSAMSTLIEKSKESDVDADQLVRVYHTLLEHGAQVENTQLHTVCKGSCVKLFEAMADTDPKYKKQMTGISGVRDTLLYGSSDMLKAQHAYGANLLNMKDKQMGNASALHIAVMSRHPEQTAKVAFLISLGHKLNVKEISTNTPLHRSRDASTTQLLLDAGAAVNEANHCGKTPVFFARSPQHIDMLFQAGADLNKLDKNGRSVVWTAWQLLEHNQSKGIETLQHFLALGAPIVGTMPQVQRSNNDVAERFDQGLGLIEAATRRTRLQHVAGLSDTLTEHDADPPNFKI